MKKLQTKKLKYHDKLLQSRLHSIGKLKVQETLKNICDTSNQTTNTIKDVSQDNLDMGNISKCFRLSLENYGPYFLDYSIDGNNMLLVGKKGYVAMMNWKTKHLIHEMTTNETVKKAAFLNNPYMFVIAQQNNLEFYDKATKIHSFDTKESVSQLCSVPYHWLLVTGSSKGKLFWLDISTGEKKSSIRTSIEFLSSMNVNKSTGVTLVGDSKGVLSMWTPTCQKAIAYLKCHQTIIKNIAITTDGSEFATSGSDNIVKIWDTRNLKQTKENLSYNETICALDFLQRDILGIGLETKCKVLNRSSGQYLTPYGFKGLNIKVDDLKFCPNENVMGITSKSSFTSVLVPDIELQKLNASNNPYASKSQKQEATIQMLVSKIPSDLITHTPDQILAVQTKYKRKV